MKNCVSNKGKINNVQKKIKSKKVKKNKAEILEEVRRLKTKGQLVMSGKKVRRNITIHAGLWEMIGEYTSNKSGLAEMLLKKELEKELGKSIVLDKSEG